MHTFKVFDETSSLARVLYYYNQILDTRTTQQKIICPFHEDVNPSMIVNLEDNSYFCFGCQLSGSAVDFVRTVEERKGNKLNDLEAYKAYIKILFSDKTSTINIQRTRTRHKAKQTKELYARAYDYYKGLKTIQWHLDEQAEDEDVQSAKAYMKERGIGAEALNYCKAKVTYNKSYQLIFPMLDNGKFKGWVSRTMLPELSRKRKYLYNEGFKRVDTLVGTYGNKNYCFIVEGYIDWLNFKQYKPNEDVVAILGWKISTNQIKKLKDKGVEYVISALDNDQYGKKGTSYLGESLETFRFSYLKGIKDIGEMDEVQFNKCYNRTMSNITKEQRKQSSRKQR